ncbi:MAG TPA: glycyl-radical enzyme activating protein [Symbiobacteriaceae bacterium]|nr:glycyl-radical enzyme activating protein [Symbiobacteriaceae bacterium]
MGIVFDLQRFALHDGPGIRTTVFLKGCPLRCVWCHNPESQLAKPQHSFDYNLCRRCLAEGHACPNGVSLVDEQVMHDRLLIKPDTFADCPYDAVQTMGRSVSMEQVMAEVAGDLAYYRRSGGGLTISGGEPMAQSPFALALARAAHEAGIHVCLDTCGQASQEHYRAILPYVDLLLYDYKVTESAEHKRLTGVGNDLILGNLAFLLGQGARVVLRCPLVPGVNDSDAHLAGIAALAARHPELAGVEIMAYHDFGAHKAVRVGQQPGLTGLATASEEQKGRWLERLRELGCDRAVLG